MKRDIKINCLSVFCFSLLLSSYVLFAQDEQHVAQPNSVVPQRVQEKTEPENNKLDEQKKQQELDLNKFFGDTDVLNAGETIRSITKPYAHWQLYLMSWGTWVGIRLEALITYIKKVNKNMRRRVTALIGLRYAQKEQQARKA